MTSESETFKGGCACGELRYRMTKRPLIVHCCHCSWCQRQTGTAFAINALVEADCVEILKGEVSEVTVTSPSGAGQRIARCTKCQVAVWSNYLVMAAGIGEAIRFIRVGTLDEPGRLPPDVHIYTSSRLPWLTLPEDAKVFDEYYVTGKTWSADSLRRRAALIEKLGSVA